MLALSTDYRSSHGDVMPYLRAIAAAGFTHIHWCQEWDTDYLYADEEIRAIGAGLREYGLRLSDLHASSGQAANWGALQEESRRAGVTLVANRLDMTARLGGDAIILHLPAGFCLPPYDAAVRAASYRSLDDLLPVVRATGVRIALENMHKDNFAAIKELLHAYGPELLGLCYDAGHGNMAGNGLRRLADVTAHLLALHLHDNDGLSDQHRLPFTGTVDWARLTALLADSPYRKPLTLEVIAQPEEEDTVFLKTAWEAGERLTAMVADAMTS